MLLFAFSPYALQSLWIRRFKGTRIPEVIVFVGAVTVTAIPLYFGAFLIFPVVTEAVRGRASLGSLGGLWCGEAALATSVLVVAQLVASFVTGFAAGLASLLTRRG